jgi:hypothetical protein
MRVVLGVALGCLAACVPHPVGPARTFDTYEGKAATTAQSALSVVETVRLAAETASDGDAFGPYVSTVVSDGEGALDGLAGTFASIQPPGDAADILYGELSTLLDDAGAHVRDVRVAARRGQLDALAQVAGPLAEDAEALRAFAEAHA